MEPTTTFGFIASGMESPAAEIQDFDRVMQLYWPRVLRFVMACVRDRDAAETLTQECFWSAYKNRNSFRGDSSVNTWLMRIAVNAVRKSARNRRLQFWRQLQHSAVDPSVIGEWLPDGNISPEASTLVHEQVQAVWDATKNLSQRQRTVFLLRFMEDMNILEIAEATGLTENAVNVHLFRAVRADSTDDALRAMASLTQTDSMGRYRLENVPPGRYYIAAGRVDQPTYYPGTLDMTKGAAISISSAATVPDIDFVIQNVSAMLPPALGSRGRGGPITLPLARNNVLNLIPILPGANALGAGQRRGPVTSNPTPAVPGAAARFRPSEAFGPVNQRYSDWCDMVDQRRFGSATWSDG